MSIPSAPRGSSPARSSSPQRAGIAAALALATAASLAAARPAGEQGPVATAGPPPAVPSLAETIAAMPRNLPRAAAPSLSAAIAAARAAHRACTARNVKVSVLIADAAGKPVVLLSGDGAGVRSQLIAQTKVNIVAKYGRSSGEVADAAMTDPALTAAAAADPDIGMLRGGGLPVRRSGQLIGIVAVSGGSLGGTLDTDEACARVAVAKLAAP